MNHCNGKMSDPAVHVVLLNALFCHQVLGGIGLVAPLCRALNALPLSSQNTFVPSPPATNPSMLPCRAAPSLPLSPIGLTSWSQTPPLRRFCSNIQTRTLRFSDSPSHSCGLSVMRSCSSSWMLEQSLTSTPLQTSFLMSVVVAAGAGVTPRPF